MKQTRQAPSKVPTKETSKDSSVKELSLKELEALEPIVDQLLTGTANVKDVAARLAKLGHPNVLDHTEQLRLALRLLECHDDSVGSENKRQKPARMPEADLA